MSFKIIAVDFDGTLCTNAYPDIGEPNTKLIEYLKQHQVLGNRIILWTCRTGRDLEKAVFWCRQKGLIFDAVNENIPGIIAAYGGDSRKVTADIYIDDRAVNPKHLIV